MEDFMHFIKYAWQSVFRGIMTGSNQQLKLWRLLVEATLHYLTPANDPPLRSGMPAGERARNAATIAANIEEAAKKMREYARMLQSMRQSHSVPDDMFSSNLHMVVCRLPGQERERGRSCWDSEFWVEHGMQRGKKYSGSHAAGFQRALTLGIRERMSRQTQLFLDTHTQPDFDDNEGGAPDGGGGPRKRVAQRAVKGVHRARKRRRVASIQDCWPSGMQPACQLLGKGNKQCYVSGGGEWVRQACCQHLREIQPEGWSEEDINSVFSPAPAQDSRGNSSAACPGQVAYFKRAQCRGLLVHSCHYGRAVVRNNCWAQATFLEGIDSQREVEYASHIQFWVRVQHPHRPELVLRLAIARLFTMATVPNMPEHFTVARGIPLSPMPVQQQQPQQVPPAPAPAEVIASPEVVVAGNAASQARRSGRTVSQGAQPATQEALVPRQSHVGRRKSTLYGGVGPDSWYAVNGEQFNNLFVSAFPHKEAQLDSLLAEYSDVFTPLTGLPPDRSVGHTIPLEPGNRPPATPMYRLSKPEHDELKQQIQDLLAKGMIEPSSSPYAAPVLFGHKKSGELRMCIDYRQLNKITLRDQYSLPRIDDLFDKLSGCKVFSSLDLQAGYHQIRITPEDVPKTAFRTPEGYFQFKVLCFGLTNAPTTFQRVMNDAFASVLGKCALVYLDDILVMSRRQAKLSLEGGGAREAGLRAAAPAAISAKSPLALSQFEKDTTCVEAMLDPIGSETPVTQIETAQYPAAPAAPMGLSDQLNLGYQQDPAFAANADHSGMYQDTDGLWRISGKDLVVVPNVPELREHILHEMHDAAYAGHVGMTKTLERVTRVFWWNTVRADVRDYVGTCDACQRDKSSNSKPGGLLRPLTIPGYRWEHVSMDLVTKLPAGTHGYDAICVIVDRLSKMVHFVPCKESMNAMTFARLFVNNVFKLHGLPAEVLTDRGAHFNNKSWHAVKKLLGMKTNMSTAYRPQSDGQTERYNRVLEEMLRHYISPTQIDWPDHLALAEFAVNNSWQESIHSTPFFLNTGQSPVTPGLRDLPDGGRCPSAHAFATWWKEGVAHARQHMADAQARYKRHADTGLKDVEFEVGTQVLLSTRNLRIKTGKVRKFVPRYVGPFVVEAKINANAYRLTLPANMSRLHPVFHVSLLKKYSGSDVGIMPPPVEWMDETPVYYVERLLDHRYTRAGKAGEYLVQWEGYDASFNTWEPRANLTGCDKLLAEYNAIHCLK
ncbi:hypothetical protein QJQ45_003286 [Haematococcus lacustris]|nr:hypothetical protein QJQ45_003286 [Haematococcus lacustris]